MISINKHANGEIKDTAANILASSEFVVHLADEAIAEQMHACGASLPPDESEVEMVGFTTVPSQAIVPPRIAEAPVAFECRLWEKLETDSRYIFIGKILWMHARDELIDLEKHRVRLQNYFPVARFGASFYINTRERYALGDKGSGNEAPRSTAIDEI
jgi:flavin reductase (DIM6/NTAB) family NADH-FMN oxidoreductase RutF